jgi:uncharacterized protein YndB with AHSA1/START domain
MGLIVCPTTVIAAPAETVWRLLTQTENYDRWAGVELVRASQPGDVREGQVLDFETRAFGRTWRVRFDVGRVEPPRSLELTIHLPFGTINHEHVVLSPIDANRTRVTFN